MNALENSLHGADGLSSPKKVRHLAESKNHRPFLGAASTTREIAAAVDLAPPLSSPRTPPRLQRMASLPARSSKALSPQSSEACSSASSESSDKDESSAAAENPHYAASPRRAATSRSGDIMLPPEGVLGRKRTFIEFPCDMSCIVEQVSQKDRVLFKRSRASTWTKMAVKCAIGIPLDAVATVVLVLLGTILAANALFLRLYVLFVEAAPLRLKYVSGGTLLSAGNCETALDWLENRAMTYVPAMTYGQTRAIIAFFANDLRASLLPDFLVQQFMLCGPLATKADVAYDRYRNPKSIRIVFDDSNNWGDNNPFYDVRSWRTDMVTGTQEIVMYNDVTNALEKVRSTDPDWSLAKAHLQMTTSWYVPALAHNWVHFHFLSAAVVAAQEVRTGTIFGEVLRAHLRFTAEINVSGHSVGPHHPHSTGGATEHLPWKSNIHGGTFRLMVADRAHNYYVDKAKNEVRDVFPAKFVQDRLDPEFANDYLGLVPYLDFLTEWYKVIREFVNELFEHELIEAVQWAHFVGQLEKEAMPGIKQANRVDVFATLIWTSAICHSVDHKLTSAFRDYGNFRRNKRWSDGGSWEDLLVGEWLSGAQWNLVRTHAFYNLFATRTDDLPGMPVNCFADVIHYGGWKSLSGGQERFRDQVVDITERFHNKAAKLNEDLDHSGIKICDWKWFRGSVDH